jgi:hypothetical protein
MAEVAAGDKPSNASGPAAQAGEQLLLEAPDITEPEAEQILDGLLGQPVPPSS